MNGAHVETSPLPRSVKKSISGLLSFVSTWRTPPANLILDGASVLKCKSIVPPSGIARAAAGSVAGFRSRRPIVKGKV